ncbi:hypothetical protein [Kitasatospora purpeofusca]|uniref:hypothetical protein n=1 Tax=Kitasatospora purpeofusca TaxID=67352 RepID=UPI00225B1AEF|nr:hypothetical protein [Kitasatospora purpeofusca]MCX4755167.1 hypothetical protein [Kitasatospora purpeofusca]WSR37612.1 hypothetical protein OG715_41860 [Kitasatospora purpeofusca]WSR45847.1 hypothetical protein OG196_42740 [Kitasatospora purpeofusca]
MTVYITEIDNDTQRNVVLVDRNGGTCVLAKPDEVGTTKMVVPISKTGSEWLSLLTSKGTYRIWDDADYRLLGRWEAGSKNETLREKLNGQERYSILARADGVVEAKLIKLAPA